MNTHFNVRSELAKMLIKMNKICAGCEMERTGEILLGEKLILFFFYEKSFLIIFINMQRATDSIFHLFQIIYKKNSCNWSFTFQPFHIICHIFFQVIKNFAFQVFLNIFNRFFRQFKISLSNCSTLLIVLYIFTNNWNFTFQLFFKFFNRIFR